MVIDDKLAEIRAQMAALATLEPHLATACRPVPEVELAVFERRIGVRLPDGYRSYLAQIGEGAALPGLVGGAVLPLGEHHRDAVWSSFEGPMDEPFPHTGTDPIALPWDDDADDYVRMDAMRGTLCLGSAGCDEVRVLVVTGPDRGRVWNFVPGLDHELHPTGLEFLDWVVQRLDRRHQELLKYRRLRGEDG